MLVWTLRYPVCSRIPQTARHYHQARDDLCTWRHSPDQNSNPSRVTIAVRWQLSTPNQADQGSWSIPRMKVMNNPRIKRPSGARHGSGLKHPGQDNHIDETPIWSAMSCPIYTEQLWPINRIRHRRGRTQLVLGGLLGVGCTRKQCRGVSSIHLSYSDATTHDCRDSSASVSRLAARFISFAFTI